MDEMPTALRVQAATIPDGDDVTVAALLAWADTAAKLLRLGADEIEQMQRDQIGTHRINMATIRWLEQRLEQHEPIARS